MGIQNPGDTLVVTAVGLDTFGNVQAQAKPSWSTANPAVAKVAPSAPQSAVLSAVTDGVTTLTVMAGIAQVVVAVGVGQEPPTVTIIPMVISNLVIVTPVCLDAYGMPQPIGTPVYTIGNPALATATVQGNGSAVIRALANGITTLTIAIGGGSVTIELEIGQAAPIATSIVFSPTTPVVLPNLTPVPMTATVLSQFLVPIPGAPVSWSSSNTQGILVSSIGVLQAVKAGSQSVITATSGNASASFLVATVASQPTSIVPSIASLTNAQASANGQVVQELLTTIDQYGNDAFAPSVPTQVVISPQGPLTLVGVNASLVLSAWRADQYGVGDGTVPLLQSTDPIYVNVNPTSGLVTELVAGGAVPVTATDGALSSAVTVLTT